MSSLMLRRTFLRLAAGSSFALALPSYAIFGRSEAALKDSLRRLLFAVGPWGAHELAAAEEFFKRFWHAVPVSGDYRRDAEILHRLSERFPPGTHSAREIDLASLSLEERKLLEQLVDGLYNLQEIRDYVGGEPSFGACAADRSRYVQAPGSG